MKYIKNALFDGVTEGESQRLFTSMSMRVEKFKKGDTIYHFNAIGEDVGFVVDGLASIIKYDAHGNEILLENLFKGSLFGGVFGYMKGEGEYIVAEAKTELTIIFIPISQLYKSCSEGCDGRHKVVINILSLMAMKTTELSQRVEILACRSIKDKLICYFSTVCEMKKSNEFKLDMTLSSLAEYVCADRSAMMRELKRLKEENKIVIVNKTVKVNL